MKKSLFIVAILAYQSLISQNYTAAFIKSVFLNETDKTDYSTIFEMNKTFAFSFDDLEANQKRYFYKIQHCDYQWNPSNINTSEFIEGYAEYEFTQFENSFNTLQPFTHHRFQLPNSNTRFRLSGNYLITILNENEEICIQRRIVLHESKVTISAKVIRDRDVKNIQKNQVVQFSIYHQNLPFNNPSKDIKVAILQNNDWNFIKKNLKPLFFKPSELVYNFNTETSFLGGNEFLNFDSKNVTGGHVSIARTIMEAIFHTYLYTNYPRASQPYTYFPDINGSYKIKTVNGTNQQTESDYTKVHFSLQLNPSEIKEPIYVYGAFNNFETNEENQLKFNSKNNLFEVNLLLKQGFYNYAFATKDKKNAIDKNQIDGSFYDTENAYTILVYYKPFGARSEQVIGATTIYKE